MRWLEEESRVCFGILVSTQQGTTADFKSVWNMGLGQNRVKSGQIPSFKVKHNKNEKVVSQEMSHVDDTIHA